jgi:hypothetical protein
MKPHWVPRIEMGATRLVKIKLQFDSSQFAHAVCEWQLQMQTQAQPESENRSSGTPPRHDCRTD